jgi:hypothetical protein
VGALGEATCVVYGSGESMRSCCPATRLQVSPKKIVPDGPRDGRQTLVFLRNHEISRMTSSSVAVFSCKELLTELNSPVSADLYFASQVEGCLGHLQHRGETVRYFCPLVFFVTCSEQNDASYRLLIFSELLPHNNFLF